MKLGTSISLPLDKIIWLKNRPEGVSSLIEHALDQIYCMSTVVLAIDMYNIYWPIETQLKERSIPYSNFKTFSKEDSAFSREEILHSCKYVVVHLTNTNNGLTSLADLTYVHPDKVVILAQNISEQQILELHDKNYRWFFSIDDVVYFLKSKIILPKR